jgi:hypothetical protein
LTMAGRKLADVILQVAEEKIASGTWALAEIVEKGSPSIPNHQKKPSVAFSKKARAAAG